MDIFREIVLDSIEALLLLGVFQSLYNREKFILNNKIKTLFFCISSIIANFLCSYYIPAFYHIAFLAVLTILFITYFTRINILASGIIYSVFIIIILSAEYFVSTVEIFLFKVSLNDIFNSSRYFMIFLIASKSLQAGMVIFLFKFRKIIAKYMIFKKEGSFISNIIIQVAIFAIFIFSLQTSIGSKNNFIMTNVFLFTIYFLIFVLKIKDLREAEKNMKIQSNYQIQESQIRNMEEIIGVIRQEKHDYANHINVIGGLCALNKPDSLKKINEYVTKISNNIHDSFVFLNTGNDYLDGLLSIKKNYAIKNNITFDVEINESFDMISIREDELISIVSNLVDNAFDALKSKKEEENKEICIATFLRKDRFCIEVANNGKIIPNEIKNKIFEKGFSTKTEIKGGRGYGLYITKQLIEQNNGSISVESNERETVFLVELDLKGESLFEDPAKIV